MIGDGETLDELPRDDLKIIQGARGYRYSLDPFLLCAFAEVPAGSRVADLGTGSGIVPLLLARRSRAERIVGVACQPDLAGRARRSVRLNDLQGAVQILRADIRYPHPELPAQGFDVVLTNPPYRAAGSGRRAPHPERATARHELAGGLADFLAAAARLLGDGGRFYIIYLAERAAELLARMGEVGLEPKRLRCVHGRQGDPARIVLVEGRRRGRPGLHIEPPLFVYVGKEYSPEVRSIYGESD
jgi:tRNA1Val (adenine37-N6)-methyltransferase